jgi:hypothetical protein
VVGFYLISTFGEDSHLIGTQSLVDFEVLGLEEASEGTLVIYVLGLYSEDRP